MKFPDQLYSTYPSETLAFAARAAAIHPEHWDVVYRPETEDWVLAPAALGSKATASTDAPPEKDPFLAHEALDRAHVLSTMFDELLLEHGHIEADPLLRGHARRISNDLADLYQRLGRAAFEATDRKAP